MISAGWVQGRDEQEGNEPGTVSLIAEVPTALVEAMRSFIDNHPNWDQYRLVQAALAGFLVQHGCHDRAVTRWYLTNLFPAQGHFDESSSAVPRNHRPMPGQGRPPGMRAA